MNDPDDDSPLPGGVLIARLGIYRRWVYRHVKALGITPDLEMYNDMLLPCYPTGTLTLLRERRARYEYERSLPKLMTAKELAEALGRSDGWTRQIIKRLGIKPSQRTMRRSRQTNLYAKGVYFRLRNLLDEIPIAEHEFNLQQLVEITGFDREWIERRLKESGIAGSLKRSPLNGRSLWYYGKEALPALRSAERPPSAGTWLTAEAIEEAVGKSSNWTRARLSSEQYLGIAQLRLDAHLVPRLHYPPRVVKELKDEVAKASSYPEAGDYLLVYAIARIVGRSTLWVNNRLALLNESGELRQDKKGRLKRHYSPDVVEKINQAPARLRGRPN